MTLYEARMQVVHDCPYSRLARKYPEVTIAMWCNFYSHVFEISAPSEEIIAAVQKELNFGGSKQQVVGEGNRVRMVLQACDCNKGVGNAIEQEGLWYEEPVIYREGWENYRIIGSDRSAFERIVKRIEKDGGTVQLLSLKPLQLRGVADDMILTTSTLFAGLTDRQVNVLASAVRGGYFREAAELDLDDLASRAGLSRSTYAEHLRKAQNKMFENLCPLIQMAAEMERAV
ncbi:MAG TPA: helix-turn-helix domain-containing protein [Methanomassiliicoccales archaeon]|nr:helix-turn-helix domain-containing protein [Methanomassiliicoccales archaeon]